MVHDDEDDYGGSVRPCGPLMELTNDDYTREGGAATQGLDEGGA
jgi:hypothetical protein